MFGKTIIKILNKYPDWSANVIGDEPREEFNFNHKKLNLLGFKKHKEVLLNFEKTSIAVVCSRWNEPFGRTSLEASSRGCGVIISNRGGLPETITNGVILKDLSIKTLFFEIENLIKSPKQLKKLQTESLKNFILNDNFISKKIDECRSKNLISAVNINKKNDLKNLKILHVTNFNDFGSVVQKLASIKLIFLMNLSLFFNHSPSILSRNHWHNFTSG
ncbi:glycosyltransferase [Candidatus Pelagibacter sp.]|nr:glycosyltransferase [Candidatus Pelagibacter sp.]